VPPVSPLQRTVSSMRRAVDEGQRAIVKIAGGQREQVPLLRLVGGWLGAPPRPRRP
jgi:hypothetical protein